MKWRLVSSDNEELSFNERDVEHDWQSSGRMAAWQSSGRMAAWVHLIDLPRLKVRETVPGIISRAMVHIYIREDLIDD